MLLTEAPSLRTLRSSPPPRPCRDGGKSGPPLTIPPLLPPPPLPTSSPSPKSEGSGSESESLEEVEGGDKWSTEPTGDVAESDMCIPARLCVTLSRNNSISSLSLEKYVATYIQENHLIWFLYILYTIISLDDKGFPSIFYIKKERLTRIWTDSSCDVSVYQSASPSSGAAPRSITT